MIRMKYNHLRASSSTSDLINNSMTIDFYSQNLDENAKLKFYLKFKNDVLT